MGSNDLVHPMRLAAGVGLRAVDFVTQPGDRSSPDVVVGGTTYDCAAMIGFVSDRNDLHGHLVLRRIGGINRLVGRPARARLRPGCPATPAVPQEAVAPPGQAGLVSSRG